MLLAIHAWLANAYLELHNFTMVDTSSDSRWQIFRLLVIFRWLSLIPPLAALYFSFNGDNNLCLNLLAFAVAVLVNLIITRFAARLNIILIEHWWSLSFDLLLVSFLLAFTGGWRSPYYLYILSPILAAAFFFGFRGGVVAVAALVPLYFAAIAFDLLFLDGASPEWLVIILFISGGFLIATTVGYASDLLRRLQSTQDSLYRTHQELKVLHDLSSSLQLSPSINDVEKQALIAITRDLGFHKAAIGLINQEAGIMDRWQVYDRRSQPGDVPVELTDLWLPAGESLIWKAVGEKAARHFQLEEMSQSRTVGSGGEMAHDPLHQLDITDGLAIPLLWGITPVGVLLVSLEGTAVDQVDHTVLAAIARQTAVSLGMMMTRLRHAKESAVFEERTRIALDLHDTISQSLFGLVYTLQGCLKLLPDNPQALPAELEWALATAEDVRQRIRATIHNMWPDELTAQRFENDLRSYAANVLHAAELDITFDIRGEFNTLSPPVRRGMYRICQESLTNMVHHAAARESRICVDVADGRARITLRDDGRGFEPHVALAQDFSGDHFGLRGMRERAASLGGTCEIFSQPGAGTSILIDIPANAQAHHE